MLDENEVFPKFSSQNTYREPLRKQNTYREHLTKQLSYLLLQFIIQRFISKPKLILWRQRHQIISKASCEIFNYQRSVSLFIYLKN